MKNRNVLLAVLGGVAAGALIGMLIAPGKGSKTRKKITKGGEEYFDALRQKYADLLDRLNHKLDSLKEEAGEVAETGATKTKKTVS
jgi:gas vesicle protein